MKEAQKWQDAFEDFAVESVISWMRVCHDKLLLQLLIQGFALRCLNASWAVGLYWSNYGGHALESWHPPPPPPRPPIPSCYGSNGVCPRNVAPSQRHCTLAVNASASQWISVSQRWMHTSPIPASCTCVFCSPKRHCEPHTAPHAVVLSSSCRDGEKVRCWVLLSLQRYIEPSLFAGWATVQVACNNNFDKSVASTATEDIPGIWLLSQDAFTILWECGNEIK